MSQIDKSGTAMTVSLSEARNRLADLVDLALSGIDITLTRSGVPVIKLSPILLDDEE